MSEEQTKKLNIKYRKLREWLACPECHNTDAKVEKGSLQLFCPNCKNRENLAEGEIQ